MSCDTDVYKIYNGYDNLIELILTEDAVAYDLAAITRIDLKVSDAKTVTNSTPTAFPIKWESGAFAVGQIQMQLGAQSIVAGKYLAKLILFSPSFPNGEVWAELALTVE